MRYRDGTTVRVGDLVWLNGGTELGYVQVVAESKEEYEGWGLSSPHIFVANLHPFDPTIKTGIAHAEESLNDEGIGLLTAVESAEFRHATDRAFEPVVPDRVGDRYSVKTDIRQCQVVGWVFTFFRDDKPVQTVRVPANW